MEPQYRVLASSEMSLEGRQDLPGSLYNAPGRNAFQWV